MNYFQDQNNANPLLRQTQSFVQTTFVVRAFYALLTAHCFVSLRDWQLWFATPLNLKPVWATFWLTSTTAPTIWAITTVFALILCGLCAWLPKTHLRIAAAILLFMHFAIEDSRDTIRHGEHGLLWVSVILAFLPNDRCSERRRQVRYQRVFYLAQSMILLFYGMAGGVKVLTAIVQGMRGERTFLNPDAAALVISEWLQRGEGTSLLGSWMIHHPIVAWGGLLASVVVELACLIAIVSHRIRPLVAVGLIGMHVSIGLIMDVWFPENVALLAILLLAAHKKNSRR
ncbi:MAG: hypothetical protein WAO83_19685 [Fuerstiella sp.]